jgi:ubiquinone/menaquinone biosynthesis C-methylase UbiE
VALKKFLLGNKLKTNTFWFDGVSQLAREVKENVFTWRALDVIYNLNPPQGNSLEDKVTRYWNKLLNVQAVRNRLRLVKQLMISEIKRLHKTGIQPIRILSIASGSAQGTIEALEILKKEGMAFQAMLLDIDQSALENAKILAKKGGVFEYCQFVNKSTTDLELVTNNFKPHLVEMVGFLEYRPFEKAVRLLSRIRNILEPGGVLIVSQIMPNPERFFLTVVVNWPMIYRSQKEFLDLIMKAGFKKETCQIIQEPLGIHSLAICFK